MFSFAGIPSSGILHVFIATALCIYVIKYFRLHIQSFSKCRSVTIPTLSYFFLNNSTYVWFISTYNTIIFISLPHFYLCWTILYLFLSNIKWICHWETRNQDNYMLYCLCMNWIIDVQWPIDVQSLWKSSMIFHWSRCTSVVYVVICKPKSKQQNLYFM